MSKFLFTNSKLNDILVYIFGFCILIIFHLKAIIIMFNKIKTQLILIAFLFGCRQANCNEFVALASYIYDSFNEPTLVDSISSQPLKVLNYSNDVNNKFKKEVDQRQFDKIKDCEKLKHEFKELVQKFEKKSPIFLLCECTQEGFGACLLSRKYQSKYRQFYEDKVVADLISKLEKNHGGPIHYTSFGCGGLFQDLVILTKVLNYKPDAKIVINLIDNQYTPYVAARDFLNDTREIDVHYELDLKLVMPQLKKFAREEGGLMDISDTELEVNITGWMINWQAQIKQLISFLKKTFEKSILTFYIHDNVNSYFSYLEKNNLPFADVITAADIDDEISMFHGSVRDFTKLAIRTIQNKTKPSVIILSKLDIPIGITVFTGDKPENKTFESKLFVNDDGTKTQVYFLSEKIESNIFSKYLYILYNKIILRSC